MKFKIKHLGNLLIRFFTRDKYYVCEECHKIHKRDGREIRLDEDVEHLMFHPMWYASVGRACFNRQQENVWKMLRDAMLGNKKI